MKVLILSASVGAGHVRAAEAMELALRQASPSTEVINLDILTVMPPAFVKVYRDAYFDLVARSPQLLGWLYDATDKPFHKARLQAGIERAAATQLIKRIREIDADVVICTHFLPIPLLDRERKKGRIRARIVTVVTDFDVHGMWLSAPSDHYFVATEEAKAHLLAFDIAPDSITVSGIPTHPIFAQKKDRQAMRRKHGWDPDLPAILVSAGGFGAGNAGQLVEALVKADIKAQIIAVCGKSAPLKAAIDKMARTETPIVKAIGFTTEMDELMSAADLMIGKPGGLTTSESLIKGLAWVVVNPIPGQEEKNTIYLLEQGAGVWSDNLHTLGFKVKSVLEEGGRLKAMRKNALRLAQPGAGKTIAEFCLNC